MAWCWWEHAHARQAGGPAALAAQTTLPFEGKARPGRNLGLGRRSGPCVCIGAPHVN